MKNFPNRFVPISEFLLRHAQWYPRKDAVRFKRKRLTWRALNRRTNSLARGLIASGLSKGDRVAVLSRNRLEYPEIVFGILKCGGVVVPLSTLLHRESVARQLKHARAAAVIAESSFAPLIEKLSLKGPRVLMSGSRQGWIRYEEFLGTGDAAEPQIEILPEDPYNIIYSSGTTGHPKGIVHTQQGRALFALTCGMEFRIHNETVTCIATPLYSNGTLLTFLPTVMAGGTLVIMESFRPDALLQTLERERCTHVFMVPTQYQRVMEHPDFGRYDTSSVEMLVSAAAPLDERIRRRILKKFPKAKLAELYGLTEGVSTILRPDEQLLKPGSVGKPRMGGDIKIIDDDGNELPRGKTGEIVGSSVSMMRGYYRNRKATENAAWEDSLGRNYLKTGDIGSIDRDGYLQLKDRKKDMIISGGFNIYPSDLEVVLLGHQDVAEAAVIGVPHEDWGESPLALVVKKSTGRSLGAQTLREWANRRLSGYQKIFRLEFLDSLPRNDLGKILKKELREAYR